MKWILIFLLIAFAAHATDHTEISLDPIPTVALPDQPIETPDVGAEK